MNPLGLITLQFVRPLKAENFDIFPRMRSLGFDFAELLVPEKGELDLADTRKALEDAGLGCVLAARLSIDRDIASARADARQSGIDYLRYCADVAEALGAQVVGNQDQDVRLFGISVLCGRRAANQITQRRRKQQAPQKTMQHDHLLLQGEEPTMDCPQQKK